ncbi:MAG: signal peptidase I [Gammaproteobacteria bacterium]|nr:signal peptidase I [Gammaproteobacteria bacterium]MBT8444872.1 signal peptidase I [Gammaproteobacteria bacterium]NND37204.1 signal peptidase I [Gammaproteobacteria bacterium]
MSLDFSLILVVATALSGAIWGVDALLFKSRRSPAEEGQMPHEPVVVEYARSFFPVLFIVLVVRSFLFEPFRIPSSSMVPTLLVGDFIFVNKYTYGLRLPVTNMKVVSIGQPERGDVIVFKLPADPGTNYIKRLVGLPGDTVRYQNRRLFINGAIVNVEDQGVYPGDGQPGALLYNEELGSATHEILLMPGQRSLEGTFRVPEGHYFMMGDNRDNSKDSRYRGVGLIPENKIVGKAVRIWMNWSIPEMPKWGRIGMSIK